MKRNLYWSGQLCPFSSVFQSLQQSFEVIMYQLLSISPFPSLPTLSILVLFLCFDAHTLITQTSFPFLCFYFYSLYTLVVSPRSCLFLIFSKFCLQSIHHFFKLIYSSFHFFKLMMQMMNHIVWDKGVVKPNQEASCFQTSTFISVQFAFNAKPCGAPIWANFRNAALMIHWPWTKSDYKGFCF